MMVAQQFQGRNAPMLADGGGPAVVLSPSAQTLSTRGQGHARILEWPLYESPSAGIGVAAWVPRTATFIGMGAR